MDDFFDDDRPLTGEAKREYLAVMRHATIWDMKNKADEIAAMQRCLRPTPTLDVELPQLDPDPHARQMQLLLMWLVERKFRRRLQANLARSLELLAGSEV